MADDWEDQADEIADQKKPATFSFNPKASSFSFNPSAATFSPDEAQGSAPDASNNAELSAKSGAGAGAVLLFASYVLLNYACSKLASQDSRLHVLHGVQQGRATVW